jgi:hypothetical protein
VNQPARHPPTITLPARSNGGALVVSTEPLADDDTYLVTIRDGITDLALVPHEAWALAEALAALADSRQQFAAASITEHLEATLAGAPGLTTAQYDALHAVIRRHHLRARSA